MRGMMVTDPASVRQIDFIQVLLDQRDLPDADAARLRERIAAGTLTKGLASDSIGYLKSLPYKSRTESPMGSAHQPVTEPGIYEFQDKIYKVQRTRDKQRLYAKVLAMTIGEAKRLTATGSTVKSEYVYAPGVFRLIDARHRITGERAEELSIIFNNCIVCGRHLKAADSVKAGIGPVCRKSI